jgi:membrane associated rhomboid family serine protease
VTPWVRRLIVANIIVFFLQQTVAGVTNALAFVPAYTFVRPWTLVTYMFVHANITHILFNMLALYFFGPRVEERLGETRFVALYAISGISGAVLSLIFAPFAPIVGASGAIFGVMLGFRPLLADSPDLHHGHSADPGARRRAAHGGDLAVERTWRVT